MNLSEKANSTSLTKVNKRKIKYRLKETQVNRTTDSKVSQVSLDLNAVNVDKLDIESLSIKINSAQNTLNTVRKTTNVITVKKRDILRTNVRESQMMIRTRTNHLLQLLCHQQFFRVCLTVMSHGLRTAVLLMI